MSYLVGSALSIDDLCKAGAQYASAIFVFCNPVTHEDNASLDDAANVLRALSVTNFNPGIELFVQIIRSEDREMLRNSNVDVVLCLDEFRTAMQVAIPPSLRALLHTLSTHSISFSQPTLSQRLNFQYTLVMQPLDAPLPVNTISTHPLNAPYHTHPQCPCKHKFTHTISPHPLIQARNALCPGLSTLIENLFQTFGEMANEKQEEKKVSYKPSQNTIC